MTKEELRKSLDFVNEERERLQDRIDKAIEIIEKLKNDSGSYYDETMVNNTIRDLLNILRGKDNE